MARSGHSISIVKDKAWIYGGTTAAGKIASKDIHAVALPTAEEPDSQYSAIPALAENEEDGVPNPRTKHAACAFNVCIAVFGGLDESGQTIDEGHIWLFVTAKSSWETLKPKDPSAPAPEARSEAHLFDHKNKLLLYGGKNKSGESLKDVWLFDYVERTWTRLPEAPVPSTEAAYTNGILHLISGNDNVSGNLHILAITPGKGEEHIWHTLEFPTNPLTPGPRPRTGAGLLPIHMGHGRLYLLYLFGKRELSGENSGSESADPPYWSDMWTYQLPSAANEAKATLNVAEMLKPARIKDSIRSALGADSGGYSWSEVEVLPPKDLEAVAGKVHPGPRGYFGCGVLKDGKSVVIWGGLNAKGETEGDGWIIRLE